MNKYNPPLKIHFLVQFILFFGGIFILTPLMLFTTSGTINISGLEYNLPEYPWLRWIGSLCLFIFGVTSIMVLKNTEKSLSYLGFSILLSAAVTIIHPLSTFEDIRITVILSIFISGYLIFYDIKRKKIRS